MKRLMILVLPALLAVGLAGCRSCPNPNADQATPFGEAPETCHQPVYRSPCDGACTLGAPISALHDQIFGCERVEAPIALASEVPVSVCDPSNLPKDAKCGEVWCCVRIQPPAAAPERICTCPEQVIEHPVAAVFETVQTQVPDQPARCEWQRVECEIPADAECWKLVEIPATFRMVCEERQVTPPGVRREVIPAQFEMRASAPPPAYYEWRRATECEVGPTAATPQTADGLDYPPAGG